MKTEPIAVGVGYDKSNEVVVLRITADGNVLTLPLDAATARNIAAMILDAANEISPHVTTEQKLT